jgi:hypothetical protein
VQVSLGDQYMPFHSAWMETFEGLGYPQIKDRINGTGTGPFVIPGTIDPVTHTRSHKTGRLLQVQLRGKLFWLRRQCKRLVY